MDIFGHHVSRHSVLLATLDAALFVFLLQVFRTARPDGAALIGEFGPVQTVLLTAALLFMVTALGLYNENAQKLGILRIRFLVAWPALLLGSLILAEGVLSPGAVRSPDTLGVLAVAMSVFVGVVFVLHLAVAWWLGLSFMKKKIVVIGDGDKARALVDFLNGPARSHFRHVGTVGPSLPLAAVTYGNAAVALASPAVIPLCQLVEEMAADQIVVAVEDRRNLPLADLLECRLRGIEVLDSLTFWEREAGVIDADSVGADWLAFSGGFSTGPQRRVLKRSVDILLSLTFLIAVAPLCLFVALAIRLESPGPIFYRQERVGLNGRVFEVWKFRSMTTDAERDGVAQWAAAGDARVTRVGRFIRKVRIDEIPQVINVLAGDMSFIGPRPERPFFVEQLREVLPFYDLRHRVRPGITGWAQVNYPYGASVEDARRKLCYDLYYLKKNDLLLDLAILVQTVRVVLFAHGGR